LLFNTLFNAAYVHNAGRSSLRMAAGVVTCGGLVFVTCFIAVLTFKGQRGKAGSLFSLHYRNQIFHMLRPRELLIGQKHREFTFGYPALPPEMLQNSTLSSLHLRAVDAPEFAQAKAMAVRSSAATNISP
jgi:hypothetical protein